MTTKIIRKVARAARHFEPTWRYLYNLGPTLAYRFSRKEISGEASRVLEELRQNGIAITSPSELFGSSTSFAELDRTVAQLQERNLDQLSLARKASLNDETVGKKTFLVELLGGTPVLDPDSIYARFALQERILSVANAYFGMFTRLRYYNVWHTLAGDSRARESQLWHRDREDHHILKVFVCLSDVNDEAGPFTYAPGTHRRLKREPSSVLEGDVKRSNDEQMAEVVPRESWIKGTGPRGTIIFADTSGYHKGGLARTRDRVMYTCMFTSPASESKEFLSRPGDLVASPRRPFSFALAPSKPGLWLAWK